VVRHLGPSEVGVETIRRAQAVHPVSDLQIEYSIASRGPEAKIFPALAELGIGATLYGVFSRGLLTGSRPQSPGDFRRHLPRFGDDQRDRNSEVVAGFLGFAQARGLTPGQLAIAWVRARQPSLLPVIGAKTIAQLDDALGALEHRLSGDDLAALDRLVPAGVIGGERYSGEQMRNLDSER